MPLLRGLSRVYEGYRIWPLTTSRRIDVRYVRCRTYCADPNRQTQRDTRRNHIFIRLWLIIISTMWFQPKGANNQQRDAERDNLADQPTSSVEQAAPPSSSDAMAPAKSAHAAGSLTSTTRSGRGHRKTTNDKKSVPVVSSGDGPNLSTIVEEADESMRSDLASER